MAENVYRGEYIRSEKLHRYPLDSQRMMSSIVSDFEGNYFVVIRHAGSYSIKSRAINDIALKISCTAGTSIILPGLEVAVLFRSDAIDELSLGTVNEKYPTLEITGRLLAAGSADRIRDFYFTTIDSKETYQNKKDDIVKLANELVMVEY